MRIYTLLILSLIVGLLCGSLMTCDKEPIQDNTRLAELHSVINNQEKIIKAYKKKETLLISRVDSLKRVKSKIKYKTKFDTLATIDTVIVELIKCDSVVQVDAKVINTQDTLIYALQKEVQAKDTIINSKDALFFESEESHKKEVRRLKRKLFFTKVGGVALIVGIIAVSLL